MLRRNLLPVLLSLAVVVAAPATRAESIVISGAGSVGTWDTAIELANPSATDISVQVGSSGFFNPMCGTECSQIVVHVPGGGDVTVMASSIIGYFQELNTLYVSTAVGVPLPSVRSRVIDAAHPTHAVELIPVRSATLLTDSPSELNFPASLIVDNIEANLAISFVDGLGGTAQFSATVEAYSTNGTRLAVGTFSNCAVGCTMIFLNNVLDQLGIPETQVGRIRVVKNDGPGVPWGFLSTVDPNGSAAIAEGINS
jgi:hypothetical protein